MKISFVFIPALLCSITVVHSQKIISKLKFEQGQTLEINMQLKTTISQQAMGQAIDFDLDGSTNHTYKVTNATEDNNTLHHQVKQIAFHFDGMGQKRSFDSNNEKDMNGQFGKPIKEMLSKTFDMIIDPTGRVLMVKPEKVDTTKMDDRMAIITNMLKDVLNVIQPPQKGSTSFFDVFPDKEVGKGDSWTQSFENATGRFNTTFTLSDITDSTIVVNLNGTSVTVNKAEMMGNETVTTMNNKTTGTITVDKATGIIREKKYTTDSNGSTEVMGGTLPVTSTTTVVITVK